MTVNVHTTPSLDDAIKRLPAMVFDARHATLELSGVPAKRISLSKAREVFAGSPPILVNAPIAARRMGLDEIRAYDLLELYAFVRPASPVVPTLGALADAVGVLRPTDIEAEILCLRHVAQALLNELKGEAFVRPVAGATMAHIMLGAGWPWATMVLEAMGNPAPTAQFFPWDRLPEWDESEGWPRPADHPVHEAEAQERLSKMLGKDAEVRQSQRDYSSKAVYPFTPCQHEHSPNVALLEAGTGTGKTLAYLAPASVWAEKNDSPVWISTYTRNLQGQMDDELDRLYPDARVKARRAVVRKGRENYACLLNIEETVQRALTGAAGPGSIYLALVMRWLAYTRSGDMVGGDFPAWLGGAKAPGRIAQLTDRRGECVYSACAHYRRCFIERTKRKARKADLVVANHALVMSEMVSKKGDPFAPRRIVFDEGHHLFDAADSAFSLHLTGREGVDLRRWIRGAENARRVRARGLQKRVGELAEGREDIKSALDDTIHWADVLAGDNWITRVNQAAPHGPMETFLGYVRTQVMARSPDRNGPHSLEASVADPVDGMVEAATAFGDQLGRLSNALSALAVRMRRLLDDEADELEANERLRIDSLSRSVSQRAEAVAGWCAMLENLGGPTPEGLVDWVAVDRIEGREVDIGLMRHYVDPTKPFSEVVLEEADGVLITSATLRDRRVADEEGNWQSADVRTGAGHLVVPPQRMSFSSPFDYAKNTRIFVVTDVPKNDSQAVAAAYRALFFAANGGALGLFTAIRRLREVYHRLAEPLDQAGLSLLAQHVDPMDTATLVDMFRDDPTSCLLGTDALRDGVDVPGNALRMVVFDRVPWPRATLLHQARGAAFGKSAYNDMLVRLRLKQAFGRLIRRADDKGVFVMLDAATPSRLLDAFPEGVEVARVGLADAVRHSGDFLKS